MLEFVIKDVKSSLVLKRFQAECKDFENQLARYLEFLSMPHGANRYIARFLGFDDGYKVMIRGEDLRMKIIIECAKRTVNFLAHPCLLEKTNLGVGRLHMISYIE